VTWGREKGIPSVGNVFHRMAYLKEGPIGPEKRKRAVRKKKVLVKLVTKIVIKAKGERDRKNRQRHFGSTSGRGRDPKCFTREKVALFVPPGGKKKQEKIQTGPEIAFKQRVARVKRGNEKK